MTQKGSLECSVAINIAGLIEVFPDSHIFYAQRHLQELKAKGLRYSSTARTDFLHLKVFPFPSTEARSTFVLHQVPVNKSSLLKRPHKQWQHIKPFREAADSEGVLYVPR